MNNESARLGETSAKLNSDDRGILAAIEFRDVPFVVQRVFWITDVTQGRERAGHAHRTCEQFLFCIRGSMSARVTNALGETYERVLDIGETLYLPPNNWLVLSGFSPNSALGVLASLPYDRSEYIEEFEGLKLDRE